MECPRIESDKNGEEIVLKRTFRTVLKLMDEAVVSDEGEESPLDLRMNRLASSHALGEKHPAVIRYNRCVRGAADTIRSIIISANSRFDPFDDPDLLKILDGNDIDIAELGIGKNGDGKTQTALFIVISDDDDTFNFLPGMLYTQLFQELYLQARYYGGKLPIDVGFWFDEFCNIKMPASFDKIMATCRSRGIYCTIVLQSLAQIKALFKEGRWEGLVGNTDTFLFLGGNEQSTFKYVSEMLGKWTIDKKSSGETRGRNGSSSENKDVLGRELMTEAELRKLDNHKCICFVRGQDPIHDNKWALWDKKIYNEAKKHGKYSYEPFAEEDDMSSIEFIEGNSLDYYHKAQKRGENIKIYSLDLEEFLKFDFESVDQDMDIEDIQALMKTDEVQEKINAMESTVEEIPSDIPEIGNWMELSVMDLLANDLLTPVQKKNLMEGLQEGIDEETIKNIIRPEFTEEQMAELRKAAVLIKQNRKE